MSKIEKDNETKESTSKFSEKFKEIKKNKNVYKLVRKNSYAIITLLIGIILGTGMSATTINSLDEENVKLEAKVVRVEEKVVKSEEINENLNGQVDELEKKLKQAEPWFKLKKEEQLQKQKENAKIEAERLAAKQKKEKQERLAREEKEKQEKLAREEKERMGYNTGITYNNIARNPEEYIDKKVKFEGKVIQVMEGDGTVEIRLAINGDYDHIIYGSYQSSIVSSRILEDDYITIMGRSNDLLSYESTEGAKITIPSILIEKIER